MDTNLDFKQRVPGAHNIASAQALSDNSSEEVDKRKNKVNEAIFH